MLGDMPFIESVTLESLLANGWIFELPTHRYGCDTNGIVLAGETAWQEPAPDRARTSPMLKIHQPRVPQRKSCLDN
jgi:hypothetical protein